MKFDCSMIRKYFRMTKQSDELQLTEKSQLSMVLEPARDIEVTIKLPTSEDNKYKFPNDLKVSQMVQNLREMGMLSKPLKDYYVMHGNTEVDLNLPLHVYDLEKGVIEILSSTLGLHVVDEYNDILYVSVNVKTDTILDVKKMVANNRKQIQEVHISDPSGQSSPPGYTITKYVKVYENVNQMRLYKQNGNVYEMLDNDSNLKECGMQNNGKLYLVYYDWDGSYESRDADFTKYHSSFQFGNYNWYKKPAKFYRIFGDPDNVRLAKDFELGFIGRICGGRTVLSVTLRLQEQFDVPVRNIKIYNQRYQLCRFSDKFIISNDSQAYFFVYFFE